MDSSLNGPNGQVEPPVTPAVPTQPPPDREVVAQIALDLARMNANPESEGRLEAVRDDIEKEGLAAFFHAAVQTVAAEQAREMAEPPLAPEDTEFGLPIFPAVPGDVGCTRRTWRDCIGARLNQPLRVYYPATLADLRSILRQAEAEKSRVKAVGSGHSFTDVAAARDFLVETHGLCRTTARIDKTLLRANAQPATLFETEAGITVRALNEALWNAGLGLENMGGYDGQTIAGVISTSTHGSGLKYGPLPSQAVSLTIVAAGGRTLRVEPAAGITRPAAWKARHPDIELVQDDEWFQACQVGLGCMGILYSVVLRVQPRYYLRERRVLTSWFQVRADLQSGGVLRQHDHYEVLVNPYSTLPGGDHSCLVTIREPVNPPAMTSLIPPTRNVLVELASSVPGPSQVLLTVLNTFPALTPNIINEAMKAIAGEYTDRSYRVFNIGAANDVAGYASEIGFPLHGCVAAVERILQITKQRQAVGQSYLYAPFSLRFVKASPAHLSMMEGVDTCMVEFLTLDQTIGGREILQELETEMLAYGGRPHWGLQNFVSGAGGLVEAMYPRLADWQAIRAQLDPNNTFANAFTERTGLTPRKFVRQVQPQP